jgi:hypothetical protein
MTVRVRTVLRNPSGITGNDAGEQEVESWKTNINPKKKTHQVTRGKIPANVLLRTNAGALQSLMPVDAGSLTPAAVTPAAIAADPEQCPACPLTQQPGQSKQTHRGCPLSQPLFCFSFPAPA